MTLDKPMHTELRVQRTRKMIVEALTELTVEKGFAAVTVQDIVQRAGFNRATFYRHCQDKFDLLNQYAKAVYQLPDDAAEPALPSGANKAPEKGIPGIARVLEHVHRHAGFFRVMLGTHGDPEFAQKIQRDIQKRIRRSLPERLLADSSADLYLRYVSSGALGVLVWWLTISRRIPLTN